MKRTIAGYRDKLTVRPGETIQFMVSSFDGEPYAADLVRIVSGNTRASYAGLELESVRSDFEGPHKGIAQVSHMGSCARAKLASPSKGGDLSFAIAVMPTTQGRGDVCIAHLAGADHGVGLELGISSEGRLFVEARARDESQRLFLDDPCPLKRWSVVGFAWSSGTNTLTLFQHVIPKGPSDVSAKFSDQTSETFDLSNVPISGVLFAARPDMDENQELTVHHFNGRMDSPRLLYGHYSPDRLIESVFASDIDRSKPFAGFWDFGLHMGSDRFGDRVQANGNCVFANLPTRAVKGIRWTGEERDWRQAPDHYSAAHFHEDDVYDIGWQPSLGYGVPENLRSGAYAVRLKKGQETDYVLFFVAPAKATAKTAFLASTSTYLAYANNKVGLLVDALLEGKIAPLPEEQMMLDHPEFGHSHYDHHLDGSGVHFSSWLRPVIDWRPDTRIWSFNADTDILRWLEYSEQDYDVITDDLLHREGVDLLSQYQTIVTGTHPEYYSTEMLDGMEAFLQQGGRLMYMGGNGFYWRVAHSPDWPAAIELRRAEDGTRAWESLSGEYHHQFDGEVGGLWRRQDRAPQELVGVGFAAQGSHKGIRFRKQEGATDPRVSFAFDGVTGPIVCDFKKMCATPSAEELDRTDYNLGTPAHCLVLASSENIAPDMMKTKEELLILLPVIPDEDVRADVVFFETLSGGAVFSTGSIGWSSVLAHNNYDNPTARLTTNVLNRFVDDTPFEAPRATATIEDLTPQIYAAPPGWRVNTLSNTGLLKRALQMGVMTVLLAAVARFKGVPKMLPGKRQN